MQLKKTLNEMKEKEAILQAENQKIKEFLRRQSVNEIARKSSPALQSIFRPVTSPAVARRPQSDLFNQSKSSRGASPMFQPNMFETTKVFQQSSKRFGF